MLTSIGIFISWTFTAVATVVMIILVTVYVHRRVESGLRFWALTLGEIFVTFIAWQILYVVFRFITYTGGSESEILFKHSISNIAAYLIVIAILIFFDNKRSLTVKQIEESS